MGVTLSTKKVMKAFQKGDHTATFGGNPLSCAAASATIDYILEEKLVERASQLGRVFKEGLEGIKERHQIVREVRGLGLMLAMEMKFDIRNILLRSIERGVILLYSGKNILRFLPPLIINEEQIAKTLNILESLIKEEEVYRGFT